MKECPECHKLFMPERASQQFCGRHCARMAQARHGEPSMEDKKMRFADAILAKLDEIFKLK